MNKIVQTAGRNALGEFAPDFAHYNDDVLFGENWNNHDIDHKTRCIITVVALMSSGVTDSSLKYHLENAKNAGVTKAEIAVNTEVRMTRIFCFINFTPYLIKGFSLRKSCRQRRRMRCLIKHL